MILPIIKYPNPILMKKSENISDFNSPAVRELVLNMLETLDSVEGLGLAAPQVGESLSLCIIKYGGKKYILFNPVIKSKSLRKEIVEEGCLSFPGKFVPVKRSMKVTIKAQDRSGKGITIKAEGLLARALQHEIDHLEGKLIWDLVDDKSKAFLESDISNKPVK